MHLSDEGRFKLRHDKKGLRMVRTLKELFETIAYWWRRDGEKPDDVLQITLRAQ